MSRGAIIAIGVGVGLALTRSIGPAGFAVGIAIGLALWSTSRGDKEDGDE